MRVHWDRRILVCASAFFCVVNLVMGLVTLCLNDGGYIERTVAKTPADETPPTIVIKGDNLMTIARNSAYADAGAEAYDARSDAVLATEGEVNTAEVGEYTIIYTATDESGNSAMAERKVKVVEPAGMIYLTFDDGPGEYTDKLLDVLAKYHVKATFFVTGYGDDATIKREHDEGHTVALHTFSHNYAYVYASVENYFADLDAVRERVRSVTGQEANLIRFPGGSSNLVSRRYDGGSHIMSTLTREVEERGFTYFDWNVSSGDAEGATTADEVYENVVSALKYGGNSVVLQHDVKEFSVDAVERIVQYGVENGFVFAGLTADSFTAHHGVNN